MVLVAHYDLQLHQKDVKTHSLTRICMETFTWHNSKGFVVEGKERKGCFLKKSIYGLKQASRHWYLKFDSTIRKFVFKENIDDNCIYAKFKHGKSISLILHVDSTLLASSGVNLLLRRSSSCPQVSMRMILVKRHSFQKLELTETKGKGVLELSQVYT